MALERDIIMALRQVYDPEIPVNIYDLGLIYELKVDKEHNVYIQMTLTAPNCPLADYVAEAVKAAEEDVALYTSWLKETGLEETISKSMLAGNPQLIRAISAYAKKHGGTVTPRGTSMGSGPKPQGRSVNTYSQDWENYKKQRGGA